MALFSNVHRNFLPIKKLMPFLKGLWLKEVFHSQDNFFSVNIHFQESHFLHSETNLKELEQG